MRYAIYIFIILYCSCQQQLSPETIEIYRQLNDIQNINDITTRIQQRDSLIRSGENSSVPEQIALLYAALSSANHWIPYPNIKELNTLYPYAIKLADLISPHLTEKKITLALLEYYASASSIKTIPKMDQNRMANWLANLEYQQHLTDDEKCRFLTAKSKIYLNYFNEHSVSLVFAEQAEVLACKNELPQRAYDALLRQQTIMTALDSSEGILQVTHRLFEISKHESIQREKEITEVLPDYYKTLAVCYSKQKNYREALHWCQKFSYASGKKRYRILREIYIGLDSIPQALATLQEEREKNTESMALGRLAYEEAMIWEKAEKPLRYEACLKESIRQYDIKRQNTVEFDDFAPTEAYARLLWQQGKYNQAIIRLEMVLPLLINNNYYIHPRPLYLKISEKNLSKIDLLISYYAQTQRSTEGRQLLQTYDSLRNLHLNNELKVEENKLIMRNYVSELQYKINLRTAELEQKQQYLHFTVVLTILSILLTLLFVLLYNKRQKQLDSFYARQKEVEQLQQISATKIIPDELPGDELLFRRLEKQLYEEKLFLHPDFSLEDLCRLAASNRMYVSTSINKYAGMNINQWLNRARINHAVRLIRDGETNLQVLAEASGFSSTTSFFRNFKQFTLLSPKQYIDRERRKDKTSG